MQLCLPSRTAARVARRPLAHHDSCARVGRYLLQRPALHSNFSTAGYERVHWCPKCPSQLELVRPNLSSAPGFRDRAVGHYEWLGLAGLIGPCPRLSLKRTSPIAIADILDAAPRDPSLIVQGRFSSVVPNVTNPCFPITAGCITTGGANAPVALGSRVTANVLNGVPWVVWSFLGGTRLLLFFDSRTDRWWLEFGVAVDLPFGETLEHLEWTERVLDICGVANAPTSFGVPYVGCAKQLWLVDGQVASPSISELWRLQEYDTDGIAAYALANDSFLREPQLSKVIRSMPGKGLSVRLADAIAERTADRARLLAAVLGGAVEPFSASLELALAKAQRPFAPVPGSTLTFALVVAWLDGEPRVLANATTFSLCRRPSPLATNRAQPRLATPALCSALLVPTTNRPSRSSSTTYTDAGSSPCR